MSLSWKAVSVVKQWNGVKETNTATGNDEEWQKKCINDWSQSKQPCILLISIAELPELYIFTSSGIKT